MQLHEVIAVLEEIAPTRLAESWDNVGLLVGDPAQPVQRALATIDYTTAVADEASRTNCDLVIAYHPPIFAPLKRVIAGSIAYDAIRRGIAIYSPHTALDVAEGGTNDVLADILGLTDREPLRRAEPKDAQHKLIVFVPRENLDAVSSALFEAGAGRIGKYTSCSFRTEGHGTFFGEDGTNPTVGQSGRLENVAEVRVETVVPIARVDAVLAALRKAHPYEEPAFDLVRLAMPPDSPGMGRVGTLAPESRESVIARIKSGLGVEHVLVAGPMTGEISRAAVCAGACGDLVQDAIARNAGLYLTGEMRHHDAIAAARAGITVVCALHSNSERVALRSLQARLISRLPGLDVVRSTEDRDPFGFR